MFAFDPLITSLHCKLSKLEIRGKSNQYMKASEASLLKLRAVDIVEKRFDQQTHD